MGRVLKDFHVVETHEHWLRVGCNKLSGCGRTCDRFVQQWVCTRGAECKAVTGDALVRSKFQASVCDNGSGFLVRKCGACAEVRPQMKAAGSSKRGTRIGGTRIGTRIGGIRERLTETLFERRPSKGE